MAGGLVALVLVLLAALASPPGRHIAARTAERFAPDGLTLRIESLDRLLPWGVTVGALELADRDGRFLRVERLSVDIDLAALVTGAVALPELRAGLVDVARLPVLPPSPPAPAAPSAGPPPIALGELRVDRLALGPAIATRPVALALAGALVLDRTGRVDGTLVVERVEARAARLDLTVRRPSAAEPARARLTLKEDADGVLLGLLGRASGPTLDLVLDAEADARGAAARLAVAAGGEPRLTLSADWTGGAGTDGRLAVTGRGRIGDLLPPVAGPLFEGDLDLALDAALTGGRIDVPRLRVATGRLRADGSGSIGTTGERFELLVKAGGRGAPPVVLPLATGRVAFQEAALGLRLTPGGGPLPGSVAEIDGYLIGADLPGLRLGQAAWLGRTETREGSLLAARRLPFAFQADLARLGRPDAGAGEIPSLRLVARGDVVEPAGTAPSLALAEASATLPEGRATFAGTIAARGLDGTLKVALDSLAGLAPLAGRPLAGNLALDGRVAGDPGAGRLSLDLTGTLDDPKTGIAEADRLLAGRTRLAARLAAADGTLTVSGLDVTGPSLKVEGDAALGPAGPKARLAATVADLGLLRPGAAGRVDIAADLAGDTVAASVTVPSGKVSGLALDRARIALDARLPAPGRGPAATLSLAGTLAGRPLVGRAELAEAGGHPTVPALDLSIGRNRARGAVAATPEGLLQGRIDLDFADLGEIGALALTELGGRLAGAVTLAPEGPRQRASLDLDGRDIAAPGARLGRLLARAAVDDLFGTPRVSGRVEAERIAAGGEEIARAVLAAAPSPEGTGFDVTVDGRDVDVTATGSLAEVPGGRRLALATASVVARGLPIKLRRPTAVVQGSVGVRLEPVDLDVAGGTLSLAGPILPAAALDVRLAGLPLAAAERFAPGLGLAGRLDAEAEIRGSSNAPTVAWKTRIAGFRLAEAARAGVAPLEISASGRAETTATTFDLDAKGGGITVTGSGRVPFAGGGLDARVAADLPLALVGPLTGREMRLAGRVDAEVTARGSLAAPDLSGRILLKDAEVADGETQVTLKGVEGRIDLTEKTARIERLEGNLAAGGRFRLAGTVDVDPARGLPADLTFGLTDARYSDGQTVAASLGAAIAVSGPLLQGPRITGRVDLARVEITLPERVAGKAAGLKPEHRNAPPGVGQPAGPRRAKKPEAKMPALAFDLTLAAPNNRLFVRGFGLDAELGGELRLGGTLDQPVASGRFDLVRGRVEVLSKRLDFERGAVSFRGSLEPALDFEAATRSTDAVVKVLVTGTASEPEFNFTSTPALPQEEVLARLVFDRGLANLSALQAARLADAAARLSGTIRGPGMFDRIRAATGLDDIDVGQDTTGQTRVGVSKSVTDNLRVGVAKGGEAGNGRVTVDLDIGKGVKARGEAGGAGEGKLGIVFEKEY